ncbi:vitamin K epoxide reductase family protein [Candidatus Woesearchaeota archaeon]|nr:vitamin K epoxide reductase family protein [Candidatus Woesearchaeota archaeon]
MNEYIIIILSLIGFSLSFYIWYNKVNNKKLSCIIGQDCNKVVRSKYSTTFGIENEIIGMIYYALLIIISIMMLRSPFFSTLNVVNHGILIIAGISAFSSVYLTFVQIFKLKEFCEYCLAANLINWIIFIIVLF